MPPIIDAQVHVWKAESSDRPWPKTGAPHAQLDPPLSYEGLLAQMKETGVDRAILVPPSWEGDRNDYALEAARAFPDRFVVFGRIALDDPSSPELLSGWTLQPGMRGVRLTFVWERERSWLENGVADWFWPLAESRRIPVMIMAPNSKTAIARIAARYPDLTILLDHLGLQSAIKKAGRVSEAVAETLTLAKFPNVCVKLSGLGDYSAQPYPWRDMQENIKRAVDAFGPARCFWGTDLSRVLPKMSYRQCLAFFTEELFEGALSDLTAQEKSLILGAGLAERIGWTS